MREVLRGQVGFPRVLQGNAEVGKDLWKSICPLLRQSEQFAQCCPQWGLWSCPTWPPSEEEKWFLVFTWVSICAHFIFFCLWCCWEQCGSLFDPSSVSRYVPKESWDTAFIVWVQAQGSWRNGCLRRKYLSPIQDERYSESSYIILNRNFWPPIHLRMSLPKVLDFVLFSSGYMHPNTICLQKNLPPQHIGVTPALQALCLHTLHKEGGMELKFKWSCLRTCLCGFEDVRKTQMPCCKIISAAPQETGRSTVKYFNSLKMKKTNSILTS